MPSEERGYASLTRCVENGPDFFYDLRAVRDLAHDAYLHVVNNQGGVAMRYKFGQRARYG